MEKPDRDITAIRAEGRECRLSGGTPATREVMLDIVSRGSLELEYLRMAVAWLEGYEGHD